MSVADNIAFIRNRIEKSARAAGCDPVGVTLIAVSKQQSDDKIDEALAAGQHVFGENRVQEAKDRWASHRQRYPDLRLHLIGPLQTNKVKDAVALFDAIHTVDRAKLAVALAQEMKVQGRILPCFVQVNTGEENQKSGVAPPGLPVLLEECTAAGLKINGLMCIPPADDLPAPHFALLKKLADRHGLPHLSMGMSGDFEPAVALGATHVRVGSALFGARE